MRWLGLILLVLTFGCAQTRTVTITANPPDARIFINGADAGVSGNAGVTKQLSFNSPADMYRIRAYRVGYQEANDVITLDNAQSKRHLRIDLKKLRRTVNITVRPAPGLLSIDGKLVKDEPVSFWSTQLEFTTDAQRHWSTHTVNVERANFQPAQLTVSWADLDQNYTIVLEPMQKDLFINSSPSGAEVSIDGEVVGTTPLRKPGHKFPVDIDTNEFLPQKLKIAKAGFEPIEKEISWDGGLTDYQVELDPRGKTVKITTDPPDAIVRVEGQMIPRDANGVASVYLKFLPNDQGEPRSYPATAMEKSPQGDWAPATFQIGWDEGKTDYHVQLTEIQTHNVPLISASWRHDGAWSFDPQSVNTLATKDVTDGKGRPSAVLVTHLPKGSMLDSFAVSPDGQQLLYTLLLGKEKNDFRSQMYIVKSDGSAGEEVLSDGKSLDLTPSFSPGGDQIVFSSNRAGRRMSIWQMSTSGAPGITQLTGQETNDLAPVIDFDPRPRMYYQSMIDNRSDPRLFSALLGNMFRTDMQITGMQPRVSPRNDAILFAWVNDKTGKRDIYRVSTGGGTPQNLTNSPDEDDFDPVWNRDGSRIAFASDRGRDAEKRHNFDIWMLDLNKSQPPQQLTSNGSRDDNPVFDPAGNAIFFRSNRGGEWGVWRLPLK